MKDTPTDDIYAEIDNIKRELSHLELDKAKGTIIRSRARYIEEGEKPTKYFFDLEKRNAAKKHLRQDPIRIKMPTLRMICFWKGARSTESDPNTDPNFVDPPPIIADLDCD